ncbi:MAG: D-galactonate dehydratase family protein [Spirochaetales bacterium]|nr:D-galactonate dehydratase family protein [Spirochaetales bacterium]
MKIVEISTLLTCPGRNYLIVKVRTEDGLVGYGDATLNGRELAVQALIDRHLAPWLTGCEAERIEDIWQMVFRQTYWRGGPVQMTALAGVDMALWDLKGKLYRTPVFQLLGGKCRDRVRAYFHVHGRGDDELLERCRAKSDEGCHALRYSFETADPFERATVYRQPHQDRISEKRIEVTAETLRNPPRWDSRIYSEDLLRITAVLRRELGAHVELIHDAHERLSAGQAADLARKLEPFNLLFLEDPVEPLHKDSLALIRSSSTTPIAMGELYNTVQDCLPAIQNHWIDFLRVDVSHFGGITGVRKAASLAEAFGVRLALHGPSDISPLAHAANLHIDYSIPNFGIQEAVLPVGELLQVFQTAAAYRGGFLSLGECEGLGVEVDERAARSFPYRPAYLPLIRDNEGAVHDW